MHSRAVELGELYDMPILVASSFNDSPGTLIDGGASMEIRNKVRSITHDLNVAKITLSAFPINRVSLRLSSCLWLMPVSA